MMEILEINQVVGYRFFGPDLLFWHGFYFSETNFFQLNSL